MELFTTAAGITVHISDTGRDSASNMAKTPVLLLHGYLETMYVWSDFSEMLSEKYRVISMDMPGHGLSDSAPLQDGERINSFDFCADVIKCILDTCKVDSAVIGGHSMGGYAAMAFAKKYPEKTKKLILFNSHPYPDLPEKAVDRQREINLIRAGKLEIIASLSIPNMYNPDNLPLFEDKVKESVELCQMHDPEGIVASIRGMQYREDMSTFLGECKSPVLIICGDRDIYMPMDMVESMKKGYKNADFCILENCGHNSFVEKNKESFEQVSAFIG